MNSYELVEKKASWANSNFYDEYDRDRFEFIYRKHHDRRIEDKNRYAIEGNVEQRTTTEKWRKYEEIDNYQPTVQLPRDFHKSLSHSHKHNEHNFRYNDNQENEMHDQDEENHKHFSYCYLCSIKGHVHTKTEPVPVSKRRYLKPYVNPLILMKKYEENQLSTTTTVQYKFMIKTGAGKFSGTDSTVIIFNNFYLHIM